MANTNLVPCKICLNDINFGAKKCTECGGFHDWRRFVDVGNTSISLVIALISVFTIFISVADNVWVEGENVHVNVIEVGGSQIALAVTNSGEESAVISPWALFSNEDVAAFGVNIINDSKQVTTDLVINPKEIQVLTAVVHPTMRIITKSEKDCFLEIEVFNLNGDKRVEKANFSCGVSKL